MRNLTPNFISPRLIPSPLQTAYEDVLAKLAVFGDVKNPYSTLTRERLRDMHEQLVGSLKARRKQVRGRGGGNGGRERGRKRGGE